MTQVLRGYLPLNATPVDAATGPGLERNMMTTLPVLDINIYCTSYFSLVARSYVAPKNDAVNCAIAITVYIGCDISHVFTVRAHYKPTPEVASAPDLGIFSFEAHS